MGILSSRPQAMWRMRSILGVQRGGMRPFGAPRGGAGVQRAEPFGARCGGDPYGLPLFDFWAAALLLLAVCTAIPAVFT